MPTLQSVPCVLAAACPDPLPEHAVWWPAGRVLFIADLHLGKAATYRALGQPVPAGTTRESLRRLDALIARHRPAQLVFLGDFLHGPLAQQAPLLDPLHAWRAGHHGIAMTLVRGNHDDRAGDPPATLDIEVVDGTALHRSVCVLPHLTAACESFRVGGARASGLPAVRPRARIDAAAVLRR